MKKVTLAAALMALALGGTAAHAQDISKIRIGTEGAYPPWNATEASGDLVGFDIDLGRELCKRLKAECTFVAQDWDGIIPALQAGKYDVIMAAMSVTEERKQVIDFAGPYAADPGVFAAPKDSELAKALNVGMDAMNLDEVSPEEQAALDKLKQALTDKTIGVQVSTIHADFLTEQFGDVADIRTYDKVDNLALDLAAGRVDTGLAELTTWKSIIEGGSGGTGNLAPVGPRLTGGTFGEGIGAGVRKADTKLKDALNKAIQEARADGTLGQISQKWFGDNITNP